MATTRPTAYPLWTQGEAAKVIQPPAAKSAQGFGPGETVPFQYLNFLFYMSGQWIQWLDQATYSSVAVATYESNMRLLGGGILAWDATTRILSWSAPFTLAIPGAADPANQVAAGQVTLASGAVAYTTANVPIAVLADLTSGSTALANINYPAGIAVGQSISGTGIPAGTTVASLTASGLTMSAAATATGVQQSVVFNSSGALTVQASATAALVPGPNTVVLARATDDTAVVGVGGCYAALRHGEQRALFGSGYLAVVNAPAGQALVARQAVYLSPGATDGGRTAGSVYPVDCSVANGALRSSLLGFVAAATSSGANATVVTDGVLYGFTGLNVGAGYYADPGTPGSLVATKPTTAGQYVVPLGTALTSGVLDINPAQAATAAQLTGPQGWPNYFALDVPSLTSSLSAAATAGGVVLLQANITLTGALTVPAQVVVQGRKGASVLTVPQGSSLSLAAGAELRDVNVAVTATSGAAVALVGDRCIVRGCSFALPTSSTAVGLLVQASSCRLYGNLFAGCIGPLAATPTGISYASGGDNLDDGTTYTT